MLSSEGAFWGAKVVGSPDLERRPCWTSYFFVSEDPGRDRWAKPPAGRELRSLGVTSAAGCSRGPTGPVVGARRRLRVPGAARDQGAQDAGNP